MTLRKGHGNGRGVPRVEVLPADELPIAKPVAVPSVPLAFRENGKIKDAATAREMQLRSARARVQRTRLLGSLGLKPLSTSHDFAPYESAGEAFSEKHMRTLASMFDGTCGEGPASIVKTAGIQLAASRFFYDRGKLNGDAKLLGEASRLGDASRQNILAAYELQAREAAARGKARGPTNYRALLGIDDTERDDGK